MELKIVLKGLLALVGIAAAIGVLAVAGVFIFLGSVSTNDIVATQVSPDGKYKAVLVETNCGVPCSFGYIVYIEPVGWSAFGKEVAYLYGASRSNSAAGVNMQWRDNRTLDLEYKDARFTSQDAPSPVLDGKSFSVNLRPGIDDPYAPPGGMFYNAQGRPKG